MGTMIMFKIFNIHSTKSIGTHCPAKAFIISGVIKGDSQRRAGRHRHRKATFPRARYVIRFDATPPGHEPIRTTPAATSGSKPNSVAMQKTRQRHHRELQDHPDENRPRHGQHPAKSPTLSVVPMPNMMIWISGTMRSFRSHPNHVPNAAG